MNTHGPPGKGSESLGQGDNEGPARPGPEELARRQKTLLSAKDPSEADTESEEFSFLEPAHDPDELGWLGQYRIVKLLGQGGMGLVFQALDTRLQRSVAIKVMRPSLANKDIARQRFLREARATATIHSDHIITIHEIGLVKDVPYLVAELLEGKPLANWLQEGQRLAPKQVLNLGVQIARGLDAAHKKGVIHRDIKPANIWMEPSGRMKILDFGLARGTEEHSGLTLPGTVLGTPAYMAPEQADGQPTDARSDLFSLGCVLYEMASGTPAFGGPSAVAILKATALHHPPSLQQLNPAITPEFDELVTRLLSKDPEKRPASAAEVVDSLEAIAGEIAPPGQSASRLSQVAPVPRPATGRRRYVIVAGVAALAGVLLLYMLMGFPPIHNGDPESGASNAPTRGPQAQPLSTAQGVTDQEILLGMSAPFSGPSRELGREMDVGLRAAFNHVNDAGGVEGRLLKLVVLDDGYEPDRALANMKEFYGQRKAFAVIGNVGTPTAEKTMPYALDKKMLFFGAFTGAPLLRKDPPDRYVFNFRASYAEETAAIVKYLVESKGMRPEHIAVFAQQDGYGDAGFNGVVKMLRKYGKQPEDILRVGYPRNSIDVTAAVDEVLMRKEVRAVVMVSTYRAAAKFIRHLKDAKADLIFANVSFVGADALADELRNINPDYLAGIIVSQVVPHPASKSSLVLKYREALKQYYPNEKANFGSLEGYLNAVVFVEGLRRAGTNLTSETLVEALESIHNLDIGLGTPLNYSPSEHQASHKVWGTVLDASGSFHILDLD
jgi:eukaryotic-like serine/threonine-protein kinase